MIRGWGIKTLTKRRVRALSKKLLLVMLLALAACAQPGERPASQAPTPIAEVTAEPSVVPTQAPTMTPVVETPTPQDIRLRVVDSTTKVRTRCWDLFGERFLPVCGAVYSVTVRATAKTAGTVVIEWDAELKTYDSCCGDRTLNTFLRKMNPPKIIAGKPEFTLVNKWDGYAVEKSPSIDNYYIPTGLTSGTFVYWKLDKGEAETVTFSIVFDNGGGGYMNFPYPWKVKVWGDGSLLASFTQASKD